MSLAWSSIMLENCEFESTPLEFLLLKSLQTVDMNLTRLNEIMLRHSERKMHCSLADHCLSSSRTSSRLNLLVILIGGGDEDSWLIITEAGMFYEIFNQ